MPQTFNVLTMSLSFPKNIIEIIFEGYLLDHFLPLSTLLSCHSNHRPARSFSLWWLAAWTRRWLRSECCHASWFSGWVSLTGWRLSGKSRRICCWYCLCSLTCCCGVGLWRILVSWFPLIRYAKGRLARN